SSITAQHVAPPGGVRGNLTSVTHWLAPTSSCNPKGGTAITSHTNWYDTGEAYQQIDPLGTRRPIVTIRCTSAHTRRKPARLRPTESRTAPAEPTTSIPVSSPA